MIIELIIALLLGIIAGTITGLLPGIHINLVIVTLFGASLYSSVWSLPIAVFIAVLSFTHIMIDFIPTTLLGVPADENYLSAQPAHRLVLEGKANHAMKIAFLGVLCSIPILIVLFPTYAFFLPKLYPLMERFIPYLILGISIYLVLEEDNPLSSMLIFCLAGIIGFLAFNLPVKDPLLPLLSGLFGLSGLFFSLVEERGIPHQITVAETIRAKEFVKPAAITSFFSPILSFFPGIGAGHISLFSAEVIRPTGEQFIFINSLASSLNMGLSIVAAYAIGKTRTGSSAAIDNLLSPISLGEISIIMALSVVAIIIAYFLANSISTLLISIYNKISYKKITIGTILFVIAVSALGSNVLGLIILFTSAAIGMFAQVLEVRKIQLMGALLIPTILYYLV